MRLFLHSNADVFESGEAFFDKLVHNILEIFIGDCVMCNLGHPYLRILGGLGEQGAAETSPGGNAVGITFLLGDIVFGDDLVQRGTSCVELFGCF